MKPSLRIDSLLKSLVDVIQPYVYNEPFKSELAAKILKVIQRHGAKVRRETLKEAASGLYCLNDHPSFSCVKHNRQTILSLTPRGAK